MDIWEQLFGDRGDNDMSETPPDEAVGTDDPSFETEGTTEQDRNEQALQDLDVRVDDLETGLERTESSLEAIRSQQDDLSDDLEEINDTIRQLLGVYDQLTADSNPFTDGGESEGFGVVGGAENGHDDDSAHGDAREEDAVDEGADGPTEDVVTFEDLQDEVEETPDETSIEDDEEFLWEESQEADSAPERETAPREETNGRSPSAGAAAIDAELAEIDGGYAADLLVFEWLSELVRSGGPASALQALDYYESVGWISAEVRRDLEDVLSGPHLDVHIDPSRPEELTGDDHVDSHEYVRQLNALSSMDV